MLVMHCFIVDCFTLTQVLHAVNCKLAVVFLVKYIDIPRGPIGPINNDVCLSNDLLSSKINCCQVVKVQLSFQFECIKI